MSWQPYTDADCPPSHGRMTLAEYFQGFCLELGHISSDEIEAFMAGDRSQEKALLSTMDFLGARILEGEIRSFARPLGGGPISPMATTLWELDGYEARFITSGVNLASWADPKAPITHLIFVDARDVEAFVKDWMDDPAPQENGFAQSPHLRRPNVLRLTDVLERTGLARSTIYALIARDEFPSPIRLAARASGWHEAEVDAWITNREKTRSAL